MEDRVIRISHENSIKGQLRDKVPPLHPAEEVDSFFQK